MFVSINSMRWRTRGVTSGRFTARDGTPIGFGFVGEPPGTVIVQSAGPGEITRLAPQLDVPGRLAVIGSRGAGDAEWGATPHRRGDDAADLAAVLREVGAEAVLARGTAAHTVLDAVLRQSGGVRRLVVYEPPPLGSDRYRAIRLPMLVLVPAGAPGFRTRDACELVSLCSNASLVTLAITAEDPFAPPSKVARATLDFLRHVR
jgi:hypothetical protein